MHKENVAWNLGKRVIESREEANYIIRMTVIQQWLNTTTCART